METSPIKTALIDLDPIVYQYASMQLPDETPMPIRIVESHVLNKLESIRESSGADEWEGYLTYGPDNFRLKIATIKPYKGNRKDREKPHHYDYLRGWLSDFSNVRMVFGMEADDALSIRQYQDIEEVGRAGKEAYRTIICTIDKDLEMVPGYHYRWSKGNVEEVPTWFQEPIDGLRCFYKQLLTGDGVDNIHGLYGVGPKSTYLSRLDEMDDEELMKEHVLSLYVKWYGNYAEQFMTENGKLLWMKRSIEDDWEL